MSYSVQKLLVAQALKDAVKDAKAAEPIPAHNLSLDEALERRKRNFRASPCICHTHKLQFKNRREFRLHIKYQHSTEHIG